MKAYHVTYTFGACIAVEAESEEAAIEKVEEMETEELFQYASDGFDIQDVKEAGK